MLRDRGRRSHHDGGSPACPGRDVRNKPFVTEIAIALGLLCLAVLFFLPVTLGGRTMLPADNAFQWEPLASYAEELGVGTPHNALLGDLYVQNYVWKDLIVQLLRQGELPLWNPHILAGVPFLAAGQHSGLYPLSALFYVLPLWAAYGWYAALHLWLAGWFTYLLGRTLRLSRPAALLAGIAFMFGGLMVTHQVFPMIAGAAVWLPLLLVAMERIARRAEAGAPYGLPSIPDLALGIVCLGMVMLAGHPEMYYYVGLTAAAYALWRGVGVARRQGARTALGTVGLLGAIGLVGVGLGSAQWMPLLELVQFNFREGGAAFQDVLGWAWPRRGIIALLMPDFFGNPSHHSYLDLYTRQITPATVNALGQAIQTIDWGIKNYVEGTGYVGVLPLALAAIAVLRRRRPAGFFAFLAAISLAFVFGSPLYYLVYRLPGFSQVHTPFRWIYPFSLSAAILAGIGLDALWKGREITRAYAGRGLDRVADSAADSIVPWGMALAGAGVLGALATSLLVRDRAAALAERVMFRMARAPEAFADGRMFYSYQARNLLILGLALAAGGALLVLRRRFRRKSVWGAALAVVLLAELFVIGYGFFPRVSPTLVAHSTPALDFLASDPDLFRITTFGDDKTLAPNMPMLYGLSDIRGYDSIIPRQYVEYMRLVHPQGALRYNQIAPIPAGSPEALDSPLLHLLNVKYVVTTQTIDRPGYTLAYEGEVRIYENAHVLPRAFLVPRAQVIVDEAERQSALLALDPRQVVIIEEPLAEPLPAAPPEPFPLAVEAIHHTANEVTITVDAAAPAMLVLTDSYFPGWVAHISPADAVDREQEEQALTLYRANGNFRAVQVPEGQHVVRMKYSPDPVKFGLYLSFLGGLVPLLSLGLWGWKRYYREAADEATVQRVTKNTVAPITLNLINKAIDMAFAMLMLRILGPADAGLYYLAIVVIGWFDIWINFGLNTLATREVSRDRSAANRYLSNTIILRGLLWLGAIPLMGGFFAARGLTRPLDPATMWAIALFGIGLLPSNVSASFSSIFNAYEQMEVPASITTVTTLLKVFLGTVALLAGTGFVGLAAVSIVVNLVTMAILYRLLQNRLFRPRYECDLRFQGQMLGISWPLMINLLLATLFFRVAVLLLEFMLPDPRVLGWYSTAYKYIDAVGLVPAFFTMAIFPLMSRYAATARGSLLRAYILAIKLLILFAIPMGVLISALSTEMVALLGGSQYLPQAALILRIMIWYMPFGFINSVTQYVLIALDKQRFLTRAFAIGLTFNVVANVLLIQRIGFIASAYVAIASELALLIPFYVGIRRHLAPIPWVRVVWKPVACAAPMALLFWLLPGRLSLLGLPVGLVLYLAGLVWLRVFDADERQVVGRVIPIKRLARRPATPEPHQPL